jgi:hypothetical protein
MPVPVAGSGSPSSVLLGPGRVVQVQTPRPSVMQIASSPTISSSSTSERSRLLQGLGERVKRCR